MAERFYLHIKPKEEWWGHAFFDFETIEGLENFLNDPDCYDPEWADYTLMRGEPMEIAEFKKLYVKPKEFAVLSRE